MKDLCKLAQEKETPRLGCVCVDVCDLSYHSCYVSTHDLVRTLLGVC